MARKRTKQEAFFRYDTAEDMLAYLEAAIEEAGDDPTFIAVAIGNIARAREMMQSHNAVASGAVCAARAKHLLTLRYK